MAYTPPFEYTAAIVNHVAEISEKVGRVTIFDGLDPNPMLRRENQVRTIHSSLLIENNALTFSQVTAVLDGKHVLAPAKDIREVQNAYEAYDAAAGFDPYSFDDLLKAHKLMMEGLVRHPGCLRNEGVGVFAGDTVIHAAPPQSVVPQLMRDLFDWLGDSKDHPLVKGCVFHYEFEFIHPFMDGNGRTGRLWHSLILRNWRPVFAWIPVETLIHHNQQAYYDAILASTRTGGSTPFIEFMLRIIHSALEDALAQQEAWMDGAQSGAPSIERRLAALGGDRAAIERRLAPLGGTERVGKLLGLFSDGSTVAASDVSAALGLKATRTREILAELVKMGVLVKHGTGRYTRYGLPDENR